MKRHVWIIALVCCLLFLPGALAEEAGYGLVKALPEGQLVPLYDAPSAEGNVLMRYHGSVEVTILDVKDEWAQVEIGIVSAVPYRGYMALAHIEVDGSLLDMPPLFPTAQVNTSFVKESRPLLSRPDETAMELFQLAEASQCYILGEGDDFYHLLLSGGLLGFAKKEHLIPQGKAAYPIFSTVINDPGGGATLYDGPSESSEALCTFYNGMEVSPIAVKDGWAGVQLGASYLSVRPLGYMQTKSIRTRLAAEKMPMTEERYSIGVVAAGAEGQVALYADSVEDAPLSLFPAGSRFVVLGEGNNSYFVSWDQNTRGYVKKETLSLTKDTTALSIGVAPIGYGVMMIPESALPEEYSNAYYPYFTEGENNALYILENGCSLSLFSREGDWYQARSGLNLNMGFAQSKFLRTYWLEDILINDSVSLAAGEYTAGKDMAPGLYTYAIPLGETGKMEVKGTSPSFTRTYEDVGEALFTAYIPEGAAVILQGGGTLRRAEPISLPYEGMEWEFRGSGKFLCGVDMPGYPYAYYYEVTLKPGAERGYYVVTDLAWDEGLGKEARRIPLRQGETHTVYVEPGQFLEVWNGQVQARFGNG